MASSRLCSIEGCDKPVVARGWCDTHYCRWKRHGHPMSRHRVGNGEALAFLHNVVLKHTGDECLRWPFNRVKTREGRFYARIHLDEGEVLVSRYVCEKVHGAPPTPDHQAAHSCGKGHEACVAPGHLSWKTPAENNADKLVHGTHDRGERSANAKLTAAHVVQIKLNPDRLSRKALADRFGVSPANITMIRQGKRWAWLEA